MESPLKRLAMASSIALLFAFAAPAPAATSNIIAQAVDSLTRVDMVMVIEGIPGESAALKGAIDIEAFSQGMALETDGLIGGGARTGKVVFQDFTVIKRIDKSSPLIMQACATGKVIPTVTIYVRKDDSKQQQYLAVELKNVMISSYQVSGGAGNEGFGTEQLSLNFEQIKESILGAGDPVVFEFDLRTNVAM